MSKHKKWPIYIWFLDDDLNMSASYLTDRALLQSIDGCIGALISSYFYLIGIRSKKFYDYFFSKENVDETMSKHFYCWPSKKKKPSFAAYSRKESKWCRSCLENFNYVLRYLEILVDEFSYRHSKADERLSIFYWIKENLSSVDIPSIGLEKIILPWKCIDPKFRQQNVIDGYRMQYVSSFKNPNPFDEYGACVRDIPQFVLELSNCDLILNQHMI